MPKLINLEGAIEDTWQVLDKDFEGTPEAKSLVPMKYFLENTEAVLSNAEVGIWLESDDQPEDLPSEASALPLIAINFPKFVDGRGYSIARFVRERLNYQGDLRAIGDVLLDQLFFFKRCGFNSFLLRDEVDTERALAAFGDFSEVYQAANDQPKPLFQRR